MDLQTIFDTQIETLEKVNQISNRQDQQEVMYKNHLQKTEELRDEVFDNPGSDHTGLKTKVDRMYRNYINNDFKAFWSHVFRVVVSSGIVGFLIWLLWIFKAHNQGVVL